MASYWTTQFQVFHQLLLVNIVIIIMWWCLSAKQAARNMKPVNQFILSVSHDTGFTPLHGSNRIKARTRHIGLELGSRGGLQQHSGERASLRPSIWNQLVLFLSRLASVRALLPSVDIRLL